MVSRKTQNESMRLRLRGRIILSELSFQTDIDLPTRSILSELPLTLTSKPEFYDLIWKQMRTYIKFGITMIEFNIRFTIEDSLRTDVVRRHIASIFVALKCPCKLHVCFGFLLQSRTSGDISYYYASCNVTSSTEVSYVDSMEELNIFLEQITIEDIGETCMQNSEFNGSDRVFLRIANMNVKAYPFLDEILI